MTAINTRTPRAEHANLPDSARDAAYDPYRDARIALERLNKNPEATPAQIQKAQANYVDAQKGWVAFSAEAKGQDPQKAVAALEERVKGHTAIL